MLKTTAEEAESICFRILDMVEDLKLAYADAEVEDDEVEKSDDDEDAGQQVTEAELLQAIVEEGGERGLPDDDVEKMFKTLFIMAKKAKDN
jgi:hypothetical protein